MTKPKLGVFVISTVSPNAYLLFMRCEGVVSISVVFVEELREKPVALRSQLNAAARLRTEPGVGGARGGD